MYEITRNLPLGHAFPSVVMPLSRDRERTYIDMAHSTCGGRFQFAPPNIHTDPEFARTQGLATEVYDGLLSTARIDMIMRDIFGVGYARGGRLMTKFIRPLYITDDGDRVTIKMALKEKIPDGDAVRFVLDVQCFDKNQQLVIVGTASALVR